MPNGAKGVRRIETPSARLRRNGLTG